MHVRVSQFLPHYLQQERSPHWVIANKAMEQVNRYMSSFGLDPASRGRVNPSAVRQRDMFADDDDQSGFNDI